MRPSSMLTSGGRVEIRYISHLMLVAGTVLDHGGEEDERLPPSFMMRPRIAGDRSDWTTSVGVLVGRSHVSCSVARIRWFAPSLR